jgi:hypothetical protein
LKNTRKGVVPVAPPSKGAPLAVLAERAALHGDRLELDEIGIDLGIGAGLDRHEGRHAFAARDDGVIALDHDAVAAGRLFSTGQLS